MKTKFRWPACLGLRTLGALFRRLIEKWGSDDLRLPVLGSVALHLVLVVGLFIALPSNVEDRRVNPAPRFISAKVVSIQEKARPKSVKKAVRKTPTKRRPARKTEPQKKYVSKPKPQPDRKAIALKKKQEEEKRRKEQAEKERKAQEKVEKERRGRLQKLHEQEMLAALTREQETRRQAAAQARADQLTVTSYKGAIAGLIVSQWSRPLSARNGMQAILNIRLTPTGEVIAVRVIKKSGDEAFDRSAEQAVNRAAPFREIQSMDSRVFEQNFRDFNLLFRPEDLLE